MVAIFCHAHFDLIFIRYSHVFYCNIVVLYLNDVLIQSRALACSQRPFGTLFSFKQLPYYQNCTSALDAVTKLG